jgi:hypothetical protein
MPGGERFSELEHNVESVINYAESERREEALATLDELRQQTADRQAAFHLPPDFFFACPNEAVGDMVRHMSSTALYPCPAYDFAAVMAMIGTLKSHLFISSLGHPPVNYFLCFGPSGIGKNHAQQVVSKAMSSLGEGGLLASSLKTEKGLYRGLSENGSRYFVMLDEIEGLLSMLTSEGSQAGKVETYTRSLKDALLKLYTHWDRHFRSALTGDTRDKPYEIPNPHLNLIGYGTPTALTHGFSLKSISDGLLPRFTILSTPNVRESNDGHDPQARLLDGHLEYLREVVLAGKGKKEESYLELEDLQAELSELEEGAGRKSAEDKKRIGEILSRMEEINLGGRVVGKPELIPFTDKAQTLYKQFMKKMDAEYNRKCDEPTAPLYTRVAEKAGRLATVIAESKVDTKVLQWCLDFCEKQLESEVEACGKDGRNLGGGGNYEEKHYQKLMVVATKIAGRCEGYASKRDISRAMRVGGTLLDKLIALGVQREELKKVIKKGGRWGVKKVECYRVMLPEI